MKRAGKKGVTENPEMTNQGYPDTDVRIEDSEKRLKEAAPTRHSRTDGQHLIDETNGVGGADNTGEPAGGNYTHPHEETQQSETNENKPVEKSQE